MLALRGIEFCDRSGSHCGAHSQQWGLVTGGNQHHGSFSALLSQTVLHKLADFPATLTDETHDSQIGGSVPCHHSDQCALPDTRAAEDADPLSPAHRQQPIDSAQSCAQSCLDGDAIHGLRNGAFEWPALFYAYSRSTIERAALCIHYAT